MKRLVLMCFFFVLLFSVSDDDMPCVKSVGEMFETRTAKSRPVYVCAREREGRFPCRRCQLIQTHNSSHQYVRRRHLFKDVYSAFLAFSWSFNRSFLRRRNRKNKTFSETSFWRRCCQFLWEDDVSFERNTQIILERFFCFSIIVSLHRGIFLFFRSGFHGSLVAYWTLFYFFFHLPNRRIGYSWAVGSFTRRFISSLNWKTRTHFYVTSNLISAISSFLYLNWRS